MSRFPGAVIGYRTWRLDAGELWPATHSFPAQPHPDFKGLLVRGTGGAEHPWRNGEPSEAICTEHASHEAPVHGLDCHCGFNVYYEPPVDLYCSPIRGGDRPRGWPVLGAIVAWGRAVHQTDGFRTQFALPVAFWAIETMAIGALRALESYCEEWGLPLVASEEELREEAERYADPVPEEDRPTAPVIEATDGALTVESFNDAVNALMAGGRATGPTFARGGRVPKIRLAAEDILPRVGETAGAMGLWQVHGNGNPALRSTDQPLFYTGGRMEPRRRRNGR